MHPAHEPRLAPGHTASCLRALRRVLLVALLGAGIALQLACSQHRDPPNLVQGDAYLDWRDLTTYHDGSWGSSATWQDAMVEAALLDRLGAVTSLTGAMSLPSAIHLTLRVKNTAGDVLAEHPLVIGHNPWRDVIAVEPLDLYLRIATWRLGHDVLILHVAHPHSQVLDINVLARLMHHA